MFKYARFAFMAGAVLAAPTEGSSSKFTGKVKGENADPALAGDSPATEKAPAKSIVPSKYAGKYKNGGSGPTAMFIKEQSYAEGACDFPKFFELCAKNGVPAEKITHFQNLIADPAAHGSKGKARMTLGNMLIAKARKGEGLVGLDGQTYDVKEEKAAVTGAAAKAQETATGTEPEAAA